MPRNIVITGASKGIGASAAELLAPGNTIYINYCSNDADAQKSAEAVEANGGKAILAKADISSENGCVSLFEKVAATTGSVDVLVNNAGSLIKRQLADALEWDFMIESFSLNTFSAMKLSSLFVPLLKASKQDPNIINITTIGIRRGAPTASIYGAAKGALDGFTRAIAVELAPDIRVNAVSPGVIVTPFHDKISTPQHFENWKNATPLKRNGDPVDIAKAIKFVAECDFLCGETVDVNGGQYMR